MNYYSHFLVYWYFYLKHCNFKQQMNFNYFFLLLEDLPLQNYVKLPILTTFFQIFPIWLSRFRSVASEGFGSEHILVLPSARQQCHNVIFRRLERKSFTAQMLSCPELDAH